MKFKTICNQYLNTTSRSDFLITRYPQHQTNAAKVTPSPCKRVLSHSLVQFAQTSTALSSWERTVHGRKSLTACKILSYLTRSQTNH